eukprot:TRINITY_DN13088_c0_g1_i1.p1 TRINITY_DN13088_c0_g1~~TRINITY_DN13088_c0_g1_i1.p1  ORF type:complete len:489 (+),score=51.57 TRINITY_DN13088_c0_g1_i1:678-2144(+)
MRQRGRKNLAFKISSPQNLALGILWVMLWCSLVRMCLAVLLALVFCYDCIGIANASLPVKIPFNGAMSTPFSCQINNVPAINGSTTFPQPCNMVPHSATEASANFGFNPISYQAMPAQANTAPIISSTIFPLSDVPAVSIQSLPNYSDPHGIKSFFNVGKEDVIIEVKSRGEEEKVLNPYDNQEMARLRLSAVNSISLSVTLNYDKVNMNKERERAILYPQSLIEAIEEQDTDEITVTVAKSKGRSMQVTLHRSCKIRKIKNEALAELKDPSKENAPHYRLLKDNSLLNDEDTLAEAKLKNKDRLLLIIDKNAVRSKEDCAIAPRLKLADESLVPKITKSGYKIYPEVKKLFRMTEAELKAVKDLEVENEWGKILFEGCTDVTGIDFDSIIEIVHEKVVVYSEDSLKPPVGQKLNKPATIHLYKCFPKTSGTTSVDKFAGRLKNTTKRQGASFISYNAETGEWIFKVKHFSRYGLKDVEDDSKLYSNN